MWIITDDHIRFVERDEVKNIENRKQILLEAEQFKDYGGWVLDAQFIEEMGSSYLLAHGMGVPVADAVTAFETEAGMYDIYVRTKDWVPSHHPGSFKVRIDGTELNEIFGTKGEEWIWQKGESIYLDAGRHTIVLHDLTGFEGRCDAVYLTKCEDVPPQDASNVWRKEKLGLSAEPSEQTDKDVVVVGGGFAGIAAAYAAAENGCQTVLVHQYPYLGGNSDPEIGIGGRGRRTKLVDLLDERDDQREMAANKILAEHDHIELLTNHILVNVSMNSSGDRIESVIVRDVISGEEKKINAPIFIDCSGWGALARLSGAKIRTGREGQTEYQESLAPERADGMHHGNTLTFKLKQSDTPVDFPDVPWAQAVAGDFAALQGQLLDVGKDNNPGPVAGPKKIIYENAKAKKPGFKCSIIYKFPGTHFWEYGQWIDAIQNGEHIRDHLLCALYGTLANVRSLEPENYSGLIFEKLAYRAAQGEFLNIIGDYLLTENDITEHRTYPDTVALNSEAFCLHYPGDEYDFYAGSWKWVNIQGTYNVPFRCLYSVNISNMMMAGKHISATHVAGASVKFLGNCMQQGFAVGTAAAICKKYGEDPRTVGKKHIEELKEKIAVFEK